MLIRSLWSERFDRELDVPRQATELANLELAALRRMFRLEKNTMLSQTDAVASEKGVGSVRPQMIEERSRGLFSKAHASRIEDGGT